MHGNYHWKPTISKLMKVRYGLIINYEIPNEDKVMILIKIKVLHN
jgi:hypothetical protein